MTGATPREDAWHLANQRYLSAALDEVRAALLRHLPDGAAAPAPDAPGTSPGEIADEISTPLALEELCRVFELSPFERRILLVCAGVELDASFAALCASAHGEPGRVHPTFGLVLSALPDAHWSALAPTAPLRHWRLLDVRPGETLATSPLRIDERVLHHLTGVRHLDENLIGFARPVPPAGDLVPSHRELAGQIAAVWSAAGPEGLPAIQLCGGELAGKRAIATAACARLDLGLYRMPAAVLPAGAHEFDALVRLWTRESILSGAALLLDAEGLDDGDPSAAALARRFVEEAGGPLLVASRDRLDVPHSPTVAFDVERPTRPEQRTLWVDTLGTDAPRLNGQLERITAQFDLSAPGIRAAGRRALGEARVPGSPGPEESLWRACRIQARQPLEGHARCIEPRAGWDDLVLPEAPLRILRTIEAHVRQRLRVHESWGFAARSSRGLGITALFSGTSGTGKTLAAEVLAHALDLDLYHVDLSAVVSKYIGETEKNLRRVFDAAEAGGAVLLFDEADALFGKRSEVKDSHDRYANLEVSYLLQRMEAYRGLAILTTNLKSALDDAFERRLRFRVAFPFPDAEQRAAIWRRVFPPETPTDGLDAEKLSRLDAAGGTIRNVALHAAFLAAEAGEPVGMGHVKTAARSVYAQLEKPLTDGEIRGWT